MKKKCNREVCFICTNSYQAFKITAFQQKLNSHLDESVSSMLQSKENRQTTQDCREHSKCCRLFQ